MSGQIPSKDSAINLESQVNGYENLGNTDIVHFISDGTTASWIDFDGVGGGNLFNGFLGANNVWTGTNTFNNSVYIPTLTSGDCVQAGTNGQLTTVGFPCGGGSSSSGVFTGPNPWIDTSTFNMRAVASVFSTTATCTSGSNVVTLGSASNFQNGDGIVLYGCGPTNVLSTPGSPTVTPSLQSGPDHIHDVANAASGGSTAYQYQIVARDKNGGLTAAGLAGATSSGWTLGLQTTTVSTLSRANNTVTVVTSSANGAAVNGIVFITGSTDASFSGFFVIASVTNTTTFTYTQGMDTRAGATASATGGSATVYNGNYLTWTAVTGAWQYYIYGRTSGSMALIGVTRPGERHWTDYGATLSAVPTVPDFVPNTPPNSATNDYLATTITNGAGTTTLTLFDNASQNIGAVTAKFDNGPTLVNAYNAIAGKAAIHITTPGAGLGYFINSHTVFTSSAPITIYQGGSITFNETLEAASIVWSGVLSGNSIGSPQFSFGPGQNIYVKAAYPGLYVQSPSTFAYLAFNGNDQGLILVFQDGYLFNSTIDNTSFSFSSTDQIGQGIVMSSASNMTIRHTSFIGNDSGSYGYSLVPYILAKNDSGGVNPSGSIFCEHCYFVGRGMGVTSNPSLGANATIRLNDTYSQAIRTPLLELAGYALPFVVLDGIVNDTSNMPYFANWGGSTAANISNVPNVSTEASGPPGFITGNLIYGLTMNNVGNLTGQNRDMTTTLQNSNLNLPVYGYGLSSDYIMAAPFHFPSQHTLFFDLPTPTGLAATPASGGSLAIQTWSYSVSATGVDGGETTLSLPATCTTTSGNQTCNLTWTAVTGAVSYNLYANNQATKFTSGVTTNSFSDTGHGCCNPVVPVGTTTGLTTFERNKVITPQVTLSSPLISGISTTSTLTANTAGNIVASQGFQLTAVLQANLGTPSAGTIYYCSDCTIANPCAGSGNGAIAKYLNSVWVCN